MQVNVDGFKYAGKQFVVPKGMSPKEVERRAVYECQLMSQLSHPNVIEFVGLWYPDNTSLPVLIVKMYEHRLSGLLTSYYIPLPCKLSILEDVAQGLKYLHSQNPPVVHRDLRGGTIFLTSSFVAKIGSLGSACAVNVQADMELFLLRNPTNALYVCVRAPESIRSNSIFSISTDMFCFGHLALSVICGKWVSLNLTYNYVKIYVSEVDY